MTLSRILLFPFIFITCFVSWSGALLSLSPRRKEPASCRDSQLLEQSECCAKTCYLQSLYHNSCVPCCCQCGDNTPNCSSACHHHRGCRPWGRVSDPRISLRMSQRAAQWKAAGFWEEEGKFNCW